MNTRGLRIMGRGGLVAGAVAAVVVLGGGGYALAHVGAPAAPQTVAIAQICDYLDDGGGQGSALSATPGTPPPPAGQQATMRNGDAWNTCYGTSDLEITLTSDSSECLQDKAGEAFWEGCNNSQYQEWTRTSGAPGGGYEYKNKQTGAIICAGGGVASPVLTSTPAICSHYHESWRFENLPVPKPSG